MDCDEVLDLEYGAWSKALRKKAAAQRIPLSGTIELTFRCNLRCVHCYLDGQHTPAPDQQELTTEEVKGIIDQIVDAGCLWLLLTGGDPLVRPDWKEIYLYAKRKGLILTLFTNGTLLTPDDADFLAKWRPYVVEISLYGASAETYERITGIPGSYEKCIRGIDLLVERGVPLRLKTMLMTLNQHELVAMRELAEGFELKFNFDPILRPSADGDLFPYQYRLDVDDIVLLERIHSPEKLEHWSSQIHEQRHNTSRRTDLYQCDAGRTSFSIDPYGDLGLCTLSRERSYNLREGSFRRGWDSFIGPLRATPCPDALDCVDCELRMICQQCPALSKLEYGSFETSSAYLCRLTHRRAQEMAASALI